MAIDTGWIWGLAGLGCGALLALVLVAWWSKASDRRARKIPREWPLRPRTLVNSREKIVWAWLSQTLPDYRVLVKLPVTRFTGPVFPDQAAQWYRLLNGIYCTYTIASPEGHVIACLDLPPPKGNPLGSQSLKHSLLDQCAIAYHVLDSSQLPSAKRLRTVLLGIPAEPDVQNEMSSQLQSMREHLKASVQRRRETMGQPKFEDSRLATGWELNSFVNPLDSRTLDSKL